MSTADEYSTEDHQDCHNSRKQQQQDEPATRILLSPSEILSLTDDAAVNAAKYRSNNGSSKHKVQKKASESRGSKLEEKPCKIQKVLTSPEMEGTHTGSRPGAYSIDGPMAIVDNEEGPSVAIASTIDKEVLREEIRQELMAETASATVITEIPTGQDDDRERRKCSTNWKWWIILAVVLVIVAGISAGVVVLSQGSDSSGEKGRGNEADRHGGRGDGDSGGGQKGKGPGV
eukprot:scaffold860_cov111-Cylindrotheca_fusiformis.AAC.2